MRKRTYITYDEMDVQKIVKNELENAKVSWLDEFSKIVSGFKDEVMTTLQSLHQNQHDQIAERIEKLSLQVKQPEYQAS